MVKSEIDITIRRAGIGDIEDIVALWVKLSGYVNPPHGLEKASPQAPALFRDYISNHLGRDDYILLVAEVEGQLVGFGEGLIQTPHPGFEQEKFVEVYHIYVRQPFRKYHIGRMLLRGIEEWAELHSIRRLFLTVRKKNELGHNFWLRVGFSEHAYFMVKDLPR
jgi:ribosomal protein S18 acetylase RimI-like enzyme